MIKIFLECELDHTPRRHPAPWFALTNECTDGRPLTYMGWIAAHPWRIRAALCRCGLVRGDGDLLVEAVSHVTRVEASSHAG
jgi:hypothetical protein